MKISKNYKVGICQKDGAYCATITFKDKMMVHQKMFEEKREAMILAGRVLMAGEIDDEYWVAVL